MNNVQPHILLSDTMTAAKYVLLPGDHKRLDSVVPYLENVEHLTFNRELVVSSGIGGPSTAIALHELYNIGVRNAIRIGSCGALQPSLQLGDLVLACGAVRDEGTSKTYMDIQYPAVPCPELLHHLRSNSKKNNFSSVTGIVRSHDSFYTTKEDKICDYWSAHGVLAADMETAPLFVIGQMLGMRTASILNVVVRYQEKVEEGISNYVDQQNSCLQGEKNEIILALDSILSDSKSTTK